MGNSGSGGLSQGWGWGVSESKHQGFTGKNTHKEVPLRACYAFERDFLTIPSKGKGVDSAFRVTRFMGMLP